MSDLAARVRAARAWADLSQAELGKRLGHPDDQNVKRTEAGARNPKRPEQWAIAEICGVPREFLTDGNWQAVDQVHVKLDAIAEAVGKLMTAAEVRGLLEPPTEAERAASQSRRAGPPRPAAKR